MEVQAELNRANRLKSEILNKQRAANGGNGNPDGLRRNDSGSLTTDFIDALDEIGGTGKHKHKHGNKGGKKNEKLKQIKTRKLPSMISQYFLILQRQFTQLNV